MHTTKVTKAAKAARAAKAPKGKPAVRAYNSELRREHAERTRERVLDALGERVRCGDRELSYAVLAKQARVSVPTIYRHFPERADLIRAYIARLEAALGEPPFSEEDDLGERVRSFFRRFDDPDDVVRKGRLGVMWEISRVGTVPRRRAGFEALVDRRCPGLSANDKGMLVDACVVLVSSAAAEAFHGYLGLTAEQTADRVLFALEALLEHGRAMGKKKGARR